ncbi:MAG: hypothetical protein JRI23_10860, partial [Deltaproteobacteria bacterium]|nr:hypothetical protein [Deltaproteobacteria bacterium]MBW2532178.1 hypothetical protein [Deltaproteobacteria bacterium]
MNKLNHRPPKPRSRRRRPRYPRTLTTIAIGAMAGGAVALSAACNDVEVEDGNGGAAGWGGQPAGGAVGAYY